jgi:Holliday junction resolvase RusA-like endonuclease
LHHGEEITVRGAGWSILKVLTFTIYGHVPGKKNAYAQTASGRRYKPKDIAKQINDLVIQIKSFTGNIEPLIRPRISTMFYCRDLRPDLDGKYVTLQDCLVTAGILRQDNLKYVDNFSVRGEVDKDERVIVRLEID